MATTAPARDFAVPVHVPQEMVRDIDLYAIPGSDRDVHDAWRALQAGPELIWTPRNGGHWIATSGRVVEMLFKRTDLFSNREIAVPPGSMLLPMLPIQKDGEEHRVYRAIIEPAFKPRSLEAATQRARTLAIDLIETFRPHGRCEFIGDFALILPLVVFLSIVDLPQADRDTLHRHAEVMTRTADIAKRHAAFKAIMAYLTTWIERRRAEPGADLLSAVVHSRPFGRPATDEELLGLGGLLLFGGLDTVTSMMGFVMRFLATHPDHRRWILDHPNRIASAIEEIMRRHGVANVMRTAIDDVEVAGVTLRGGEHISVATCMHGLDERAFDNPLAVDFERPAQWTATFGAGPHRCPGMNLARMEIRILVEEWLRRIPDFEVDPGRPLVQQTGGVNGILQLPLRWVAHPPA
ncbi:Cytochrome P450 [Sphingobium faniae]|nr:Cytochrome P450 [Sphingobium faniae]